MSSHSSSRCDSGSGMLWWFQVLTTFLVRVREPIASRLGHHVALRSVAASAYTASASALQHPWFPPMSFDIGLHIRMGDACGANTARREKMRHCIANLSEALTRLETTDGIYRKREASLFVASDAQAIIDEAARPDIRMRFTHVHTLAFRRDQYDTGLAVEAALSRDNNTVLEEALLELFSLSRARIVAGSMLSNMPRLAMQLCVRPPGRRPAYVSLDGNDWCTTSSCKAALPVHVSKDLTKYYAAAAKGGKGLNFR